MADDRVLISSDASVKAEDIALRTFATSFRGFDQQEVRNFLRRVGEELIAARARERELRDTVEQLQHQLAHPVFDEGMLTAALGEEAGRVLQTAREAAADIRTKAEEKATRVLRDVEERGVRLLREAEEKAARVRSEADGVLAICTDDAEKAAAAIRRAAEAESQAVRAQARADIEAELDEARARSKEMVNEASALRERVLADLVRRRGMARVQIEQLRAGRERLLEAYRVVRRTLDEATDELSVVEAEARLAAEAAARRAAAAPEGSVEELEVDLSTARRAALPLVEPSSPWSPRREQPDEPAAALGPVDDGHPPLPSVAEPVEAGLVLEQTPGEAPAGLPVQPAAEVGADAPEPLAPLAPVPPQPPAEPTAAPAARPVPEAAEPAPPTPTAPIPTPPPVAGSVRVLRAAQLQELAPAEQGPPDRGGVDELFARLRADRAEAVAKAREVLGGSDPEPVAEMPEIDVREDPLPPEPTGTGHDAAGPHGRGGGAVADTDEVVLQQRDELIDPIERRLSRVLKRLLQDEQNELLDGLRTRGRAPVESLLSGTAAQRRRYLTAASSLIEDAVRAGGRFAGREVTDPAKEGGPLTEELVDELVVPLRARLEAVLTESGDPTGRTGPTEGTGPADAADPTDVAALAEALGAAYRHWKVQGIEPLVRHSVVSAFTRGVFMATDEHAALRWLVDDDGGRCPDCDDNALAGPTPKTEAYPTGQLMPPAHPGCRCLLVPA